MNIMKSGSNDSFIQLKYNSLGVPEKIDELDVASIEELDLQLTKIISKKKRSIKSILYYFVRKTNGCTTIEEIEKLDKYLDEVSLSEDDVIYIWNKAIIEKDNAKSGYSVRKEAKDELLLHSIEVSLSKEEKSKLLILFLISVFIYFISEKQKKQKKIGVCN